MVVASSRVVAKGAGDHEVLGAGVHDDNGRLADGTAHVDRTDIYSVIQTDKRHLELQVLADIVLRVRTIRHQLARLGSGLHIFYLLRSLDGLVLVPV